MRVEQTVMTGERSTTRGRRAAPRETSRYDAVWARSLCVVKWANSLEPEISQLHERGGNPATDGMEGFIER